VKALEEEYCKRLSKSTKVELLEVKPEKFSHAKSRKKEWAKIQSKIGSGTWILLDERGRSLTSPELAKQLNKWRLASRDLTFIVGGPEGFSEEIRKLAPFTLSLSKLTLPHQLARLFLIEALYRADDILKGGPYHRGSVVGNRNEEIAAVQK